MTKLLNRLYAEADQGTFTEEFKEEWNALIEVASVIDALEKSKSENIKCICENINDYVFEEVMEYRDEYLSSFDKDCSGDDMEERKECNLHSLILKIYVSVKDSEVDYNGEWNLLVTAFHKLDKLASTTSEIIGILFDDISGTVCDIMRFFPENNQPQKSCEEEAPNDMGETETFIRERFVTINEGTVNGYDEMLATVHNWGHLITIARGIDKLLESENDKIRRLCNVLSDKLIRGHGAGLPLYLIPETNKDETLLPLMKKIYNHLNTVNDEKEREDWDTLRREICGHIDYLCDNKRTRVVSNSCILLRHDILCSGILEKTATGLEGVKIGDEVCYAGTMMKVVHIDGDELILSFYSHVGTFRVNDKGYNLGHNDNVITTTPIVFKSYEAYIEHCREAVKQHEAN